MASETETRTADRPVPPTERLPSPVPAWFPGWAKELSELFFSGTTCLFVLNGNIHDLVRYEIDGEDNYASLPEFLATQVFPTWDVVVKHDLARGLQILAGSDTQRQQEMASYLIGKLGDPATWPREAEKTLEVLDKIIERNLLEPPAKRKEIAVIFDYAQYLTPAGDLASLARGEASRLVRLLAWAQNPYIKRVNVAFCLIADRLSEVNPRLVQSPHVAAIEIPMPDAIERERFARWMAGKEQLSRLTDYSADELAKASSGMGLVSLQVLLSQAKQSARRVDAAQFRRLKKTMIERACLGLLEFIEPSHTLDLVVGQDAAKQRLSEDAALLARGQLEAAPMGYLLCGPVGTGKTFLAECYAGSIGIPCVKLRNFRSKYVGETEGNLEQVLGVLRSLGPVVVVIDEADAALGTRRAEGDSGTSSRVFSMIASQMGDTRYRGKIVWMLLTSRPDLLPIDLKRQGRAEVHLPLFYPSSDAEVRMMFEVMARKNKVRLTGQLPEVSAGARLSGADIESVLLSARRRSLVQGRDEVTREMLAEAIAEFIPSAQGLEKELQDIAAVLECTQLDFLPPDWRAKVAEPNGRTALQERMVAIRQLIED